MPPPEPPAKQLASAEPSVKQLASAEPSAAAFDEAGFELAVDRVATGGDALGRGPDGRVVFVRGAIPGERLRVSVSGMHKSRIEARMVEVLEPSPQRVEPVCRHVADGCGGCDWQHIEAGAVSYTHLTLPTTPYV